MQPIWTYDTDRFSGLENVVNHFPATVEMSFAGKRRLRSIDHEAFLGLSARGVEVLLGGAEQGGG
jgi:hypothetical protein